MNNTDIFSTIRANGYDVRELIGSGGFSTCFKVYSMQYNNFFVCKVTSLAGEKGDTRKKGFDNEMKALSHAMHPNIIQIFKKFETPTHLYQILEYCPKGDIKQHVDANGPITNVVHLFQCISKILDALIYLEKRGIAHKDIKPSNILLDCIGRPKLADFGLAAFYERNQLSNDYIGSMAFLAPEIILRKPYDPFKADIWSFGVTIYFMATGLYPWPIGNIEVLKRAITVGSIFIPDSVNPTIRKVIFRALVLNPDERISFSQMKYIIDNELKVFMPKKSDSNTLPALRYPSSRTSYCMPLKTKTFSIIPTRPNCVVPTKSFHSTIPRPVTRKAHDI